MTIRSRDGLAMPDATPMHAKSTGTAIDGTAIATAGMQTLPVGVPKIMISTMAAGNVAAYVGPTDVTMMHSVTDIQGLNRLSRAVLGNAAHAMAAMARSWIEQNAPGPGRRATATERPLVGMTMFGVTTPCVQQVTRLIEKDWEPLVFHATGIGGRSMEKLVESGLIQGVIDVSTTEKGAVLVEVAVLVEHAANAAARKMTARDFCMAAMIPTIRQRDATAVAVAGTVAPIIRPCRPGRG